MCALNKRALNLVLLARRMFVFVFLFWVSLLASIPVGLFALVIYYEFYR